MPITISWTGEVEELVPILDAMSRFIGNEFDPRPKRMRSSTILNREPLSQELRDQILNLALSANLSAKEIADHLGIDDARRVRGVLLGNRKPFDRG